MAYELNGSWICRLCNKEHTDLHSARVCELNCVNALPRSEFKFLLGGFNCRDYYDKEKERDE